ncbi:MAG TPA: serine hydrolase domain-containing protein [Pyrinomonadaceae bacterium]|nr:serine hydrolase domain-containing protein [Pyrinomonadaceae bacterium]
MMNKFKRQNRRLGFYFSVINAAIVFSVLSVTLFAQTIDVKNLADELEPEIRRAMIEGNIPSATVALVSGDKVIWTGAYGESNLWARTPATVDTVYLIGSTFKAMSTVALLQQMEQGKFKLDDPVNKYLDFKIQGEDPKNPITFRHLFTHTSGLDGEFGAVPVWNNNATTTLDEYVRTKLKVTHPPMTKVHYSNPAFTLIGYLVEKFSGVPYRQYIKENIFKPLEMTSTEFDPTPDMAERLSVPYVVNKETGKQEPAVRIRAAVYPAGITYGTILDQSNWLIANLNNGVFKGKRIISEATMEQMFTRQYDQFKGRIEGIWGNETAGFGLTWWSQVRDGDRYFAHSGSLSGYTAFLLGNRDRKFGFAILTNGHRAHQHLFKLGDRAIDLMKKYSAAEKTAVVSPSIKGANK